MTLQQSRRLQSLLLGTLAWAIAILIFFPIFWMVLTSFKTEIDAFATPPQFIFTPTLENYLHINERSDYFSFAWNSVVISFSATALCLLIAVPAAYSMAFYETQRTKGTLLWMLSTKMLPPVGVLMPIYLLAKQFGLLDTRLALIIIYTLINLPIVVWMVYTYFKDIPKDILEAAVQRIRAAADLLETLHCLCFKHADVQDIPHITHALYLLTQDGNDLLQVAQQQMLSWKAPV